MIDEERVRDLISFAYQELTSGDIEPWAAVIAELHRTAMSTEDALWLTKTYNAYDDLGSAVSFVERWPTPRAWSHGYDVSLAAQLTIGRERRNLYGGRIVHHIDCYASSLNGGTQEQWLKGRDEFGLDPATEHLRTIWGTGRLAAFEWAEFLVKIGQWNVQPTGAQLWESSGPRRSIEALCGPARSPHELHGMSLDLRHHLEASGVSLSWWDFETVVCDFHVMRQGRYYVGKHLAMIKEEIAGMPNPWRDHLGCVLRAVAPAASWVEPGVDKELNGHYRQTGKIKTSWEIG
jgi:hypothetical protein